VFIRCFHDVADLVIRYDAQIYQYVGDEVGLSWEAETGLARGHCLENFFAFERKLARRRADYEARFGVAPVFRGGMDMNLCRKSPLACFDILAMALSRSSFPLTSPPNSMQGLGRQPVRRPRNEQTRVS
jgi:hypothetical protein